MRTRGPFLVLAIALAIVSAACSSSSGSSSPPVRSNRSTSLSLVAPPASAKTVWLCRPGARDNPCESSLETTVVAADGTTKVQRAAVAADPNVDCFYVYPTVSGQPTAVADLTVDAEETAIAVLQASRFSSVCRVFAPMYRQATIAAITGATSASADASAVSFDVGYQDVLTAWREYLANDNHGRGVVLIGHSQGAGVLTRMIAAEVDPKANVRRRLVSALLLGGNMTVPVGKDVGGDFQHIAACRSARQTGCVVAYSSFSEPPPAGALFGRPGTGPTAGQQSVAGLQVLCVNPAAPSGGSAPLLPYFTTTKFPGTLGAVGGPVPTAPTPWIAFPDRYTAECKTEGGATWLQVTPTQNAGDTRPLVTQTLGPGWGLHLVDVNIAYGNLVRLVADEARAYK